jgi:hypothetical protein
MDKKFVMLLAMTIATGPSFPRGGCFPACADRRAGRKVAKTYSPLPKYPSLAQRQLIRATRGYYTTTLFPPPEGILYCVCTSKPDVSKKL